MPLSVEGKWNHVFLNRITNGGKELTPLYQHHQLILCTQKFPGTISQASESSERLSSSFIGEKSDAGVVNELLKVAELGNWKENPLLGRSRIPAQMCRPEAGSPVCFLFNPAASSGEHGF
jgi:hypothetical protein